MSAMPVLERRVRMGLADEDWDQIGAITTSTDIVAFTAPESRRPLIRVEGDEAAFSRAETRSTWFKTAVAELGDLLHLPPNWDSYGAKPVDQRNIGAALELLIRIMQDDTPAPSVVPTTTGGVQLEWHLQGIDLEVEVTSPGRLHAFCERLDSGVSWEHDLTTDLAPLVDELSKLSRATRSQTD